jgi:hypothetical protein
MIGIMDERGRRRFLRSFLGAFSARKRKPDYGHANLSARRTPQAAHVHEKREVITRRRALSSGPSRLLANQTAIFIGLLSF